MQCKVESGNAKARHRQRHTHNLCKIGQRQWMGERGRYGAVTVTVGAELSKRCSHSLTLHILRCVHRTTWVAWLFLDHPGAQRLHVHQRSRLRGGPLFRGDSYSRTSDPPQHFGWRGVGETRSVPDGRMNIVNLLVGTAWLQTRSAID